MESNKSLETLRRAGTTTDNQDLLRKTMISARRAARRANEVCNVLDIELPGEVAKDLRRELSLRQERTSDTALVVALDTAARCYLDATVLAAAMRNERDQIRLEISMLRGSWELEARQELAALKSARSGAKYEGQTTAEFVECYLLAKEPEYAELKRLEQQIRRGRGYLNGLAKAWESRMTGLQTQARLVLTRSGSV